LLKHAAHCGALVEEGSLVQSAHREADAWRLTLRDGRVFTARFLVEASGRQTSLVSGQKREFLSQYKNIAIWTHVLGGRPAQSLEGDWNIFRKEDLSAIGSFAFEDGWFWYIPVPKTINGERVLTHSLGLVTDPETLKARRDAYLDPARFMATAKRVPLLERLLQNAVPLPGKLHTATNYSMISQRFCDLEQRWLLLGDSAYFVDPLFSSGVAFAVNQAATAALLIDSALSATLGQQELFDLWLDHDQSWHRIARGFALMIDQWYHGIANSNPESRHWQARAAYSHAELCSTTLHALVDTDISPDLIDVITKNSGVLDAGPLLDFRDTRPSPPAPHERVGVLAEARLWPSAALGLDLLRRPTPADKLPELAAWWRDPVANRDALPPLFAAPVPCVRLARDDSSTVALYAGDAEALRSMASGAPYAQWLKAFEDSPITLTRLWDAGLLQKQSGARSPV
jgi:flavin-dependent dehydrogenase